MAGIRVTSGLPTSTGAGMQRGVLRAWSTPPEKRAIPDLEDLGYEYGKGQSKSTATDMEIANRAMANAVQATQFDRSLSLARRNLDKMKSANTIASILGLGGIATTWLQAIGQQEAMDKRDQMQMSILDTLRSAKTAQSQSLTDEESRLLNWKTILGIK